MRARTLISHGAKTVEILFVTMSSSKFSPLEFAFDDLTLEEQNLLLEEAELVYFIDEDGSAVYPDEEEQEPTDEDSKVEFVPDEEAIRVSQELREIFGGRFNRFAWILEPEPRDLDNEEWPEITTENEGEPKHGKRIRWHSEKSVQVSMMAVADPCLPVWSARKYPGRVAVTKVNDPRNGTVLRGHFPEETLQSGINLSEAVEVYTKQCDVHRSTGRCSYKNRCKFSHKDTPTCGYFLEKRCIKGKKCKLSHETPKQPKAKPKVVSKTSTKKQTKSEAKPVVQPKVKNTAKKIFMCKYIVNSQPCKFGDKCNFSHFREELETHVTACREGIKCPAVVRIQSVLLRGGKQIAVTRYTNKDNRRCCTVHPGELIANYIKRLTIV